MLIALAQPWLVKVTVKLSRRILDAEVVGELSLAASAGGSAADAV